MTGKDVEPKEMQRAYELIQRLRRSNEQGSAATLEALQTLGRAQDAEVSTASLREALRQDWRLRFASQRLKTAHRQAAESETQVPET